MSLCWYWLLLTIVMNIILIQLYRKHLSQYYLDFCVLLFPRYTPAIGKWNIHVFVLLCLTEVCQPSHLPTWLWCRLLLPWWLCPPTVDSDFLARSPCPLPCCEDCLEYGQILLRRKFFYNATYHRVHQLHVFLHFLFSIIICDPWTQKCILSFTKDIITWRCDPPGRRPDLPPHRLQVPHQEPAPLRARERHPQWTSGA